MDTFFVAPCNLVTYLRLVTHFKFVFVGPDQKMVTKWPHNWSPGLILGAFCTICRARPVGTGLGARFGRKPAKNKNHNYNFITYLNEGKVSLGRAWRPPPKIVRRSLGGRSRVHPYGRKAAGPIAQVSAWELPRQRPGASQQHPPPLPRVTMCPIGAYMCHRGFLSWSGTSGLRRNRGTSTH